MFDILYDTMAVKGSLKAAYVIMFWAEQQSIFYRDAWILILLSRVEYKKLAYA